VGRAAPILKAMIIRFRSFENLCVLCLIKEKVLKILLLKIDTASTKIAIKITNKTLILCIGPKSLKKKSLYTKIALKKISVATMAINI
jgi:hypothetical protein